VLEETHLDAPAKPKKVKQDTKQDQKETVLMSMIKTIKKVRTEAASEKEPSESDLPRPDVPRNIEEPTLMDAFENTENEEDDSY
jgi:hypothetical protein